MICVNAIMIMQFTAFLIYLLFASSVYHGGLANMTQRKLLFAFLVIFAVDSFAAMIIMNACTSYETARLVMYIASPFWLSEALVGFLLAVSFNGKSRIPENKYVYLAVFLYVLVFSVLTVYGQTHVLHKMAYGWKTRAEGLMGTVYTRIDDLFLIGGLIAFAVQLKDEKPGLKKKQGFTILFCFIGTLAVLYPIKLMPALKDLPVTAGIQVLIVALGIALAIRLYGYVELTPSFAASAIFNSTAELMLLVEPGGRIAKVNSAFAVKTGKHAAVLEGGHIGGIIEGGSGKYEELILGAAKNEWNSSEIRIKTEAGLRDCLVTVSLLKKGGMPAGAAIVMSDITEMKKAQVELALYRDKLESMVEERTLELNLANIKLRQKAKTAEEFTMASHHDLMEPLMSLTRLLQHVRQENREKLGSAANNDIDSVIGYAQRLHSLIRDMREYLNVDYLPAGSGAGKPGAALAQAAFELAGRLEIKYGILPEVKCSGIFLSELFARLADNSVKFAGSKPPAASVTAVIKGNEIEFSFEDSGIGVDKKYLDKIFGVFERLHSREEYPGNGIGLAICRKIVEMHNGRIWAEAPDSGGLCVKFTLPAV